MIVSVPTPLTPSVPLMRPLIIPCAAKVCVVTVVSLMAAVYVATMSASRSTLTALLIGAVVVMPVARTGGAPIKANRHTTASALANRILGEDIKFTNGRFQMVFDMGILFFFFEQRHGSVGAHDARPFRLGVK